MFCTECSKSTSKTPIFAFPSPSTELLSFFLIYHLENFGILFEAVQNHKWLKIFLNNHIIRSFSSHMNIFSPLS